MSNFHLDRLLQLFAPPGFTCLACGKWTRNSSADFPELCISCADAIPWIPVPRCPICGRGIGCPDCSRGEWMLQRPFIMNRSAVMYDERMKEWLGQYKYRGRESFAPVLGKIAAQGYKRMEQELSAAARKRWKADIVTFVPVSPSRLQERGFNQAEKLAEAVARKAKLPLAPLLQRTRDTEKQSLKSRSERLRDMQRAFARRPEAAALLAEASTSDSNHRRQLYRERGYFNSNVSPPLRIVLVDDIYTTGSTIGACATELKTISASIGREAEVYSFTLARS